MKIFMRNMALIALSLGQGLAAVHAEPQRSEKIAWFGTLDAGLLAAAESNRPMLLISGAPHCHGVPGMW